MQFLGRDPFLVAGVGSILRGDPAYARDIDLAVVGLKYKHDSQLLEDISYSDAQLREFSNAVASYFETLKANPLKVKEKQYVGGGGSCWITPSGGRFYNDPRTIITTKTLNGRIRKRNTPTKKPLGRYNSLGYQVFYDDYRPIDIQFVFNRTPDEWRKDQELLTILTQQFQKKAGKSKEFFYAVLSKYHC